MAYLHPTGETFYMSRHSCFVMNLLGQKFEGSETKARSIQLSSFRRSHVVCLPITPGVVDEAAAALCSCDAASLLRLRLRRALPGSAVGDTADDGRGQERGRLLPRHDDGDEARERRRGCCGRDGRRLGPVGGGRGGVGVEVAVELPVGAGEDEERQRDEAQHGGQPAEEVRHRRAPRRGGWRRRHP